MNLIDRIKQGAKTLAVGAAVGLAVMSYNPKVASGATFQDWVGTQGTFRTVTMDDSIPDNLMIRSAKLSE